MKYQDLCDELIQRIISEKNAPPGGRFLSEREIATLFNVSRSTARRAVTELCRQGYLVQLHGSGTYIKERRQSRPLHSVVRCSQSYEEMGLHASRRVLSQKIIPANYIIAENLQIGADESVLMLNMLYYANRVPLN